MFHILDVHVRTFARICGEDPFNTCEAQIKQKILTETVSQKKQTDTFGVQVSSPFKPRH